MARSGRVFGFATMFFGGVVWPGGPFSSLDNAAASEGFFYDQPSIVLFADRIPVVGKSTIFICEAICMRLRVQCFFFVLLDSSLLFSDEEAVIRIFMKIAQAAYDNNNGEPLSDLRFIIARASDNDVSPTRKTLGFDGDDSSVLRIVVLDFSHGSKCEWKQFIHRGLAHLEKSMGDFIATFIGRTPSSSIQWEPIHG
jgi:hypothetical protein